MHGLGLANSVQLGDTSVDEVGRGRDNAEMVLLDIFALFALRLFVAFFNTLPLVMREALFYTILRLVFALFPSYRRIAMKNLQLVFPLQTVDEHERIYQESLRAFGRVFIDLARIHTLDEAWVKNHVECAYLPEYERIKRAHPNTGVIFATGHLGSFEILAHCVPFYGHPMSFVVRSFELPRVNRWWRSKRESRGNRAIDRRGAVKEVLAEIARGRDVGVLFDQNIKRNHAVFVPFFGRPAATTKLIGIAAIKERAPVVVASISYLGADRYRINAVEVDCTDLYSNQDISADDKIRTITERVSVEYEKMILANPGEWFWFHRRWKTTPEGEPEIFYKS